MAENDDIDVYTATDADTTTDTGRYGYIPWKWVLDETLGLRDARDFHKGCSGSWHT